MLSRFEQFSAMIFAIHRNIQKLERDEMIKYGHKGAFAQYLVALIQYPEGVVASRLCELCDKDKAAVSRIVSEMQAKGLVIREHDGATVYRGRIKLTDEGKRIAEAVCNAARTAVVAVGSEMTEVERALFYQTLDRIFIKLDDLAKNGLPQT